MENLIFSLNATLPLFFTMALGMLFRKWGLMTGDFTKKVNKFVFTAALPVLLFEDLSQVDILSAWDGRYVLFCFVMTFLGIALITGISFFLKDRSIQGEFVQAGYRSSAAILGIAFIQNIYGEAHMASLMIIGTVPLYNVMAVVVLSFLRPGQNSIDGQLMKKTLKGIVTNPIILGIAVGTLWALLKIPQPVFFQKTVHNVGVLATPLGLMAMGASVDGSKVKETWKPAILAVFLKLMFLPMICLPAAIAMGFRQEKLIAVLVMAGSATTVSSYIMAKNMGHEGHLTSAVVMLTTLLSAFTLTGWLFLLKTAGMV